MVPRMTTNMFPFVIVTIPSFFSLSWLINEFVTRITLRVLLVEQKLLNPFRRTWTHPRFLVYKTIICFWWPVLATIVNLLVLFFACSSSIYRFTEITTPFTVQDKLKIYIFKKRDREHRMDYSSVKASNSRVLLSRIRPCQWPMCNT